MEDVLRVPVGLLVVSLRPLVLPGTRTGMGWTGERETQCSEKGNVLLLLPRLIRGKAKRQ